MIISLDKNGYCNGFSTCPAEQPQEGEIILPEGLRPSMGQKFDTEKMQWVENDFAVWKSSMIIPREPQEPYQPTNAEVAQMISDLQADLIIAGVL